MMLTLGKQPGDCIVMAAFVGKTTIFFSYRPCSVQSTGECCAFKLLGPAPGIV